MIFTIGLLLFYTAPFPVECEFDEMTGVVATVFHHQLEGSIPYDDRLLFYNMQYYAEFAW